MQHGILVRGRRFTLSVSRRCFVGAVASALVVVMAPSAGASARYYATGSDLALRAGPGTQFATLARIDAGAPLDIECQVQGGTSIKGNATWDRLSGGRWVADAYTTTTSRNSYASGLADCGSTATAVAAPAVASAAVTSASPSADRAAAAAAWAEARVGQVHTTDNPNASWWSGWCETLVERSWASVGVGFRYTNAASDYAARTAAGQVHLSGVPPRGALVFYAPNHVAISAGGGNVVTTTGREAERLPVAVKPYLWLSTYRGWVMPS